MRSVAGSFAAVEATDSSGSENDVPAESVGLPEAHHCHVDD